MAIRIGNICFINNLPQQEIREQAERKEEKETNDVFSKMLHEEMERLDNAESSTNR